MLNFNHDKKLHGSSRKEQIIDKLEDYTKKNDLDYSLLIGGETGIIILPNNKLLKNLPRDKNYFSPVTKSIAEVFKKEGLNVKIYDDGREKTEIILKSVDILIPTLFFLGSIPVQLALNLLANWIYDKFIRNKKTISSSIKFEYIEVREDEKTSKNIKIEGAADEVYRLLKENSEKK